MGPRVHSHVSCNVPWANAVDLNILFAPLVGKCLRKLPESTLGSGVSRHCQPSLECKQRAEVDDLAAPPWHHMLAGGLRQQPDRFQVNVKDLIEIIVSRSVTRILQKGGAAVRRLSNVKGIQVLPAHLSP